MAESGELVNNFGGAISLEKSPLASIDARVKIVAAFVWSVLLAALNFIPSAAIALACSLIMVLVARWPWPRLLRRLLGVNTFVFFMWLMLPFSFSSPGETVASIGPLEVTREGLHLAGLLTIKANAIFLAAMALLSTSPLFVLAAAGRALHFPEKLVNIFLLTVRYFYVMFQEYQRLRNAMRVRGFSARINRHTVNGMANLVGSLLIRSFDRAERVHKAMLCRGYDGVIWVRADFSFKTVDLLFSAQILLMLIVVGGYEWRLIA